MTLLPQLPILEQNKIAAWTACSPVQGLLPTDYRIDAYGHIIRWQDYGSQGEYGWEIDHRIPNALGGSDHPSNLRALHWRQNRSLGGLLGSALNRSMTGR
jgi:hypothetical protein